MGCIHEDDQSFWHTDAQGSLDNDNAARAILQYRNTPIQGIGLSPAQLLLHRRLQDSIPSQPFLYKPHPEWIVAAQHHEEILHKLNAKMVETYNKHTHNLCPLQAGDTVTIQSPLNCWWNTTGKIIYVLPERQYKIRVDGSGRIILRNRRFLRKCNITAAATPVPSATPVPIALINNTRRGYSNSQTPSIYNTPARIEPPKDTTYTSTRPRSSKIPRALSRLFPHNRPGLKELHDHHKSLPAL